MSVSKEDRRELYKKLDDLEYVIDRIPEREEVQPLYALHKKMKTAVDKLTPKGKLEKDLPFIVAARRYHGTWEEAITRKGTACGSEFRVPDIHEINQILECDCMNVLYAQPKRFWLYNSNCPDYACAIQVNVNETTQIVTARKNEDLSFFFIKYK